VGYEVYLGPGTLYFAIKSWLCNIVQMYNADLA